MEEEVIVSVEANEAQINTNSVRDIIRNLIADGATRINKLRIKNVNFDQDYENKNYIRVSFTLDRPVPGYVSKDNGLSFEKGMTQLIYTSTFAIAAVLKENEDYAWLANEIVNRPKALSLILNGATIDILQREIPKGTPAVNPFSTQTEKEWPIYDHDMIINDVINITLGKTGERMAEKLADRILMD